MTDLTSLYSDTGPERVGFILDDGEIVEVENICHDPENGFEIDMGEMLKLLPRIVATWHTHPGVSANLSTNDDEGFRNWPDLKHHIVGNDGVKSYRVMRGKVINA